MTIIKTKKPDCNPPASIDSLNSQSDFTPPADLIAPHELHARGIFAHNRQAVDARRRKIAAAADAAAPSRLDDPRFLPVYGDGVPYSERRALEFLQHNHDAGSHALLSDERRQRVDGFNAGGFARKMATHTQMAARAEEAAAWIGQYAGDGLVIDAKHVGALFDPLHTCRRDGAFVEHGYSDGSTGDGVVYRHKCNSKKFCGFSADAEAAELFERLAPQMTALIERGMNPYAWVLTLPNYPVGDPAGHRAYVADGYKRVDGFLRDLGSAASVVVGEDPLAMDGKSFNTHYNVFFFHSEYLDGPQARAQARLAWGHHAHFEGRAEIIAHAQRRADARARETGSAPVPLSVMDAVRESFKEALKYPLKMVGSTDAGGGDSELPAARWPVAALVDWINAQYRVKRVRCYGEFYRVEKIAWRQRPFARTGWCKLAGVDMSNVREDWVKLAEGVRDQIAAAMQGRKIRKVLSSTAYATLKVIGRRVEIRACRQVVRVFNLIQGGNFSRRKGGKNRYKGAGQSGQGIHTGADPPTFAGFAFPF